METASKTLTVTEAAERRRSIRAYTGEEIPQETVEEILRVAGLAPSPWNIQPWRVIVVRDEAKRQALMEAAYGQKQVGAASVDLVIYSDMQDALEKIEDTVHPGMSDKLAETAANIRDVFAKKGIEESEVWGNAESNIFLGYLLLSIEARGWSSSPMLGFDPAKVKELFDLPAHVHLPAIVAVGRKAEDGFPHHRHPLSRFVRWE